MAFCGHLYQPSLPCFSDELATACVPLILAAMHFCIVLSSWCEIIPSSMSCCRHGCSLMDPCIPESGECVLLCFIKPILGNQWTVPGFLHERAKRVRTHDWKSPTHHLTLTSLRQSGVAGSSPFTLTTSLVIPIPSSSSSNGPSN